MSRRLLSLFLLALMLVPAAAGAQTSPASRPNDPRLDDQWALAKIGLECAWASTKGSPDVTVAVIDSGVDLNHPDLKAALRDDGYNAVDENEDPTDLNGHGTHVSGIIAATIDNNEGIAGIAGGGTKILPIRVMSADGSGTNRDIIQGIQYAVSKNVQVINMSLGSLLPLDSEDIVEAIKEAHDAGVLVVVAAGNSFVPLPNFAFGIDQYALVVAATDPEDRKTDFSNYGKWVAVSAPGQDIVSTMPTYDVFLTSELPPEERFKQNYDAMSGTSQATPIVSGVAALLFARHPDWTADQVKAEIQRTAANIADQNPTKRFGPITYFEASNLGAGRIDACAAVGEPASAPAATTGSPLLLWIAGGVGALVLLLGLGLLLRRRGRRPALAPTGPGQIPPGYGPPPGYAPPVQAPPAQPSFRPTPPLVPATPLPAGAAGPAWGKLSVERGPAQGQFFLLRDPSTVIGREAGTTITIASDNSISRRHVIIRRTAGGAEIEDAGSSHGTRLNGTPLRGATPIRSGDLIEIGQTSLRFEA
jgi:subtilisin family serine protease